MRLLQKNFLSTFTSVRASFVDSDVHFRSISVLLHRHSDKNGFLLFQFIENKLKKSTLAVCNRKFAIFKRNFPLFLTFICWHAVGGMKHEHEKCLRVTQTNAEKTLLIIFSNRWDKFPLDGAWNCEIDIFIIDIRRKLEIFDCVAEFNQQNRKNTLNTLAISGSSKDSRSRNDVKF